MPDRLEEVGRRVGVEADSAQGHAALRQAHLGWFEEFDMGSGDELLGELDVLRRHFAQ